VLFGGSVHSIPEMPLITLDHFFKF